ncbi:hypothetical protein Cgig2_009485 [Carnegiea gigantea]|uniref:Protein kinase domain-containing protein n=1 Tax=Carnegiea gigantea TaxID=171969 RepID=A0A9Q1GUC9_9CARY|nr:hypothetical protein Cgig2_009485 [Carnegiea gigantea]
MGNQHHRLKIKPTSKLHQLALFFILCFHIFILSTPSATGQQGDGMPVSLSNFQALQSIRLELIDPRGALQTWEGSRNGTCSGSWAGIKCIKGQVVAIHLPFKSLGGSISSKIGMLKELRRLSLHDNLIGGTIPSSLGSLPNLRGLYLFNNRLSGSIPPSLGNSSQLQSIDLSNNLLSGFVPPSLAGSPRIYRLNLSFNLLSGSVPPSSSLSPSLTFLALEHNNFSGLVPDTWGASLSKEGNRSYQLRSLTIDYNSLFGNIPHSLGKLGNLEVLSLSHNKINGTIPEEITDLLGLRVLDLSSNDLNGSFPKGSDRLKHLSTLNLKDNHLSGSIPPTIGNLSSIILLDLSLNNFSGPIPASLENLSNLTSFNVSYNKLSGKVPPRLSKKFNSTSFVGNLQLCGFSGSNPCPSPPPVAQGPSPSIMPKKHNRKLSVKDKLLILMGSLLAILLLLSCVLVYCLIRKRAASNDTNGKSPRGEVAAAASRDEAGPDGGKLVLFDGAFVFTTDDLLSATAETMGKSPYGTMYKATLEDGTKVVVKRLREKLAKSPKEFEKETVALGRIRHTNVLPLRAYYLGPKGEKLLVFDYLSKGTLSSFLHARAPETIVDWAVRMKITMGIMRGLNHLHTRENLVHGNLTSTDVYLDEQNNPKIANYGLHRLMADSAELVTTAGSSGYRAPELPTTKQATTKTDIYSLGVIMLELLTGKPPSEGSEGSDLPQWVASMVKDERTNEVFDLELMRDVSTTGDEMLNTLKLALHLVDPSPEARPEAQQVLEQLEEINPKLVAEATEGSA